MINGIDINKMTNIKINGIIYKKFGIIRDNLLFSLITYLSKPLAIALARNSVIEARKKIIDLDSFPFCIGIPLLFSAIGHRSIDHIL